ncbi:probable disease resistance protein At4g27220 [Salvia hispanica]|uniref:probable disease resistance protein At4g27220 n=1 Tax=Salvia hispanica TaxID=49212 RepID=UPI0020099F54|nr:probable disease resistance protein At4g27220 [Salvia hispanica]
MAYEVSKVVLQASSTVYAPLKDMFSYMMDKKEFVKNLEDNLTKMIRELATFYSRKEKVDRRLEAAVFEEKNGEYDVLVKQIEFHHKRYYEFVNKYQRYCQDLPSFEIHDVSSATKVMDVVQKRKPTIKTRKFFKLATLSKKINELLNEISLVSGKMEPENVLRDKKIEPIQVKYDDIDLPSSNEYVNKIIRYLNEDGNKRVGLLGLIGVGKTTIMKRLNNQLKHSLASSCGMTVITKFDFVIWIDCHKQYEEEDDVVKGIQDVILGRLMLIGNEANSIEQNATIISNFLYDRKYLLLIDQVSSTINLDKVGAHKNHRFGRAVLASSNRKVILSMTDQQVEIKPLSDTDAMKLFLEVNGKVNDPRVKLIAESIVESCGGLPLVIKLVAYHLKGQKDEQVWSDVKRILQSETKANLRKLEGVGHAYKLAYDKLEKSQKKCLLFVTLFSSDQKVYKDYLVECWNAERFLELDVPELRAARERGATTLRELTDQYLLEDHSDEHVKMPVYFRRVAAEQEYPGENECISWMPQKIQPLTDETWKTARRMSLIRCKSKLPSKPISDNMSTLLMQCYRDLVTLGDMFFENMQKLLILDLHKANIESLPTSFSSLVSLRCLYLNDCRRLVMLPPKVEKLKKLELIDIRGTSIRSLPSEIGDMLYLRCLRISFCQTRCHRNGKCKEVEMMIPYNTISRLHRLEELTIEAGCCNQAWNSIAEQIVKEVACLEKVSTLNFHFPNVTTLELFVAQSKSLQNTDTHWSTNTLRSFNISIGCYDTRYPYGSVISGISPKPERLLRFSTGEEISSVKELLRQANSFELVGHGDVVSLSDFNLRNVEALKVCVLKGCRNMTTFVDGLRINEQMEITEESDFVVLQCLEKLYLFELQRLRSIWNGSVCSGSLANLRELTLFGCPELTTILNHEQATTLSSLEYVKVENCSEVVEIINDNVAADNVGLSSMLNKVKTVDLVDLPKLRSICKTTTSMEWRSLVKISIISCNGLRDIHLSLRNADKLETVECEESWWIQLPEEQNQKILPCHFIVVEQELGNQGRHAGESYEHGRSTNHETSIASVSNKCNGKNKQPMSRTSSGLQDILETSNGPGHVIYQSTNTNVPANEEASVGRCSKLDFSVSSH